MEEVQRISVKSPSRQANMAAVSLNTLSISYGVQAFKNRYEIPFNTERRDILAFFVCLHIKIVVWA